jgi:hypothetical protein
MVMWRIPNHSRVESDWQHELPGLALANGRSNFFEKTARIMGLPKSIWNSMQRTRTSEIGRDGGSLEQAQEQSGSIRNLTEDVIANNEESVGQAESYQAPSTPQESLDIEFLSSDGHARAKGKS